MDRGQGMKNLSLSLAGVVFLGMSALQFIRYHLGIDVVLGTHHIPFSGSLVAGVIFGFLGLWMFKVALCKKCCKKSCENNV